MPVAISSSMYISLTLSISPAHHKTDITKYLPSTVTDPISGAYRIWPYRIGTGDPSAASETLRSDGVDCLRRVDEETTDLGEEAISDRQKSGSVGSLAMLDL